MRPNDASALSIYIILCAIGSLPTAYRNSKQISYMLLVSFRVIAMDGLLIGGIVKDLLFFHKN